MRFRWLMVFLVLAVPAVGQDGRAAWMAGDALVRQRKFAEAIPQFEAARAAFDAANDKVTAAMAFSRIALCHERLGRFDKGLAAQLECVRRLRPARGGDHPNVVEQMIRLSDLQRYNGRFKEAIATLEEAIAMARRLDAGDNANVAHAYYNLAANLVRLGQHEQALKAVNQSIEMNRRLGNEPYGLAAGIGMRAGCLDALGRSEEALASLREARGLDLSQVPQLAVDLHNHEGLCLQSLGRHAEALPCFKRALSAARDPRLRFAVLQNMGLALSELGRQKQALAFQEKALALGRRLHKGDHPDLAQSLANIAGTLRRLGHYDPALRLGAEALAMRRRIFPGAHPKTAISLDHMAPCLCQAGRMEEALAAAREAVAMRRELYNGDHPHVARSLSNLGGMLRSLDRDAEALPLQQEAVAMARRLRAAELHHWASLLAELLVELGRPKEALPLYREAIAQTEAKRRGARSLRESERAAYFEELRHFRPYEGIVRAYVMLDQPERALDYAERGRARALLDLLERSRMDPWAQVQRRAREREDAATLKECAAIEQRLAKARADARRLQRKRSRADVRALAAARDAEQEALREQARMIRRVVPLARPATAETIQEQIGPGEAALFYSLGHFPGYVLLVPPAGEAVRAFPLKWRARDLAPKIDVYVASLGRPGPARGLERKDGAQAAPGDAAKQLFEALVPAPVWKEIQGLRRLYLVPFGPLHRLPFESLDVGGGKVWLEAGPPIAYVPSGSALAWSKRRREDQAGTARRFDVVALGDPVFGKGLAALPGTRRELESIGKTVKRTSLLLGADATEARLFELAPQARFLHIATHQLVDPQGHYSRLALTAPAKPVAGDDGFLDLTEVFERWRDRLNGCELVVLSACETYRGPLRKDEGPFAMPIGFLYAGAPACIASLWRVDDASTAQLFAEFYRRLPSSKDRLAAFTAARRALRKTHSAPHHWAPFVYVGG